MTTYSVGAATANNINSVLYDVDFAPEFAQLYGKEGKLTKYLDSLGKPEKMMSTATYWGYSEHRGVLDTVAVTANSAAVDIQVTTVGLWKPNEVLCHVSTGDTAVIDSVNTGTSVVHVIGRGRGGIAAQTLTAGDEIINLGSAYSDGDSTASAKMVVDASAVNYAQIFWENVEFGTETLAVDGNKGLLGGSYEARKQAEGLRALLDRLDKAHILGSAVSTAPRTMGGFYNFVDSSRIATIATLTEATWEQHLESKVFVETDEDVLAITGNKIAGGMNRWMTAKFALDKVGGKEYGGALSRYVTPVGRVTVMPHTIFTQSTTLAQRVLLLRTKELQRTELIPLKLAQDIDAGTRLARMDAWLTICSQKMGHPKHHSIIKGTTAIS